MAKVKEQSTRKTYVSRTFFSITVLPEGKRCHIVFEGRAMGGCYYTTSNPAIQKALEETRAFGREFTIESEEDVNPQPVAEEKPEVAEEKKKVTVAGIAEAKEYLVESYEYSRTSLRTKAAILAAASEHNIEFVGI